MSESKTKIDKKNVEDILALTSMQEGMLYHYLTDPGSKQYLEQIRLSLSGSADVEIFKAAWKRVVCDNKVLRSVFRWEKLDEPIQVVLKEKETAVRVIDLAAEGVGKQPEYLLSRLEEIAAADREERIDLSSQPWRVILCLLGDNRAEMLLTFHHILFDGWSNGIIIGEFFTAYEEINHGKEPTPRLKTRYKKFLEWYRTRNLQQQEQFWKDHLEGFDTRSQLPYDYGKTGAIQCAATYEAEMLPGLKENMSRCLKDRNITLATLLFTAWGILLQKYNNAQDVIFGTTVSGRPADVQGVENLVGLFINTLPLRFQIGKDETLQQVYRNISSHLSERSIHEHAPLTGMKKYTGIGKDSDLFDSLIVIDNYPLDMVENPGDLIPVSYRLFEMTHYDLTVQILPFDDHHEMKIDFHYNVDVFLPATIQRCARHFLNILDSITAPQAHSCTPSHILMLDEKERQQILNDFNAPQIDYVINKTIHGEFSAQVLKNPNHTAVIESKEGQDQHLTYRELDSKANRIAHMLAQYGVTLGSRAAMMFPRSLDMIAALFGILKSGAACIPLDMSHPLERSSFIVKDSTAGILFISGEVDVQIDLPESGNVTRVIYDPLQIENYPDSEPGITIQPTDLSYIIYTSGSTGNPKGALLHHSGIVNHTYTKIQVLGIGESDTVANNFSVNVIAAIWQQLAPLFTGARLVLYSEEIEWDPYGQFRQVNDDGVTVIEVIPPVLKAYLFMLDEGKAQLPLDKLRKIALTSEETKPALVNKFYEKYKHIDLVDCYGQTECCDDVLHYTIPVATQTTKVPVGTPSLNTQVVILNFHGQLQPVGIPGEICACGAGVMYGYWNRPELNEEKLITPPYPPLSRTDPGDRPAPLLYRTGDIGRWLADGKVEYLGRLDHQVKIRGNRVELREIENHVLRSPGMKEAAVVAREDREGEKSLYAFVVPVTGQEITTSGMRNFLLKTLPDYMVPTSFIAMDELPLTPNGKIDRKKLVTMEIAESIGTGSAYTPPRSRYEIKIREIWSRLLEKQEESIGIDDNFFDSGGHSLLLIKLKSQLEKTFNPPQEIGIIELFNYPTIAYQARFIEFHLGRGAAKNGQPGSGATDQPALTPAINGKERSITEEQGRDLAVIGIALRVPGATNIHEFWENIRSGKESIKFFLEAELQGSLVESMVKGRSKVIPAGGIIGDIDAFDADFFGFNPREAQIIEPQQRLFLEQAWNALEDAGYGSAGDTVTGNIGVYAGVGLNTYLLNNVLANPQVVSAIGEFQTMIGNDKDFVATRTAYKLNLRGPAMTVQCACSTSLVAIHLARRGLLAGDCDMALAGGVAVHVPEKTGYYYNEGGYLSPDGHCRAFDAQAQGTVFSNGIGVVVLKPLDAAVKDKDFIYALVKGSAINNDGSLKVGYTSPSEIGQAQVIYRALREARVSPDTIGYIETHGTGTVLGDPVEVAALTRAYQQAAEENELSKQYCALGSLKASIGHLDIAAGITGLIKAVLCLYHRQIPPSINVDTPNPIINFPNTPFYVNTQLKEWQSVTSHPLRAGVSSFGIGGTNAHVILEEAGTRLGRTREGYVSSHHLIILSARTSTALKQMSQNLVAFLKRNPAINLGDVAFTLQVGRKAFEHRLAFVSGIMEDAVEALESFDAKRLLLYSPSPGDKSVVFMFPGVGDQYVNMAYELYEKYSTFRQNVDTCCDLLQPHLGRDLREVLFPPQLREKNNQHKTEQGNAARTCDQAGAVKIDLKKMINREDNPRSPEEEELGRTIYCQTSVFVIEYALARQLIEWGIRPHALTGYSLGEYTAACIAGVFSLADALLLVASRAKLIHQVETGAMLAVSSSEKEIIPLLIDGVTLAAVNTPDLCILSGKLQAVDAMEKQLQEKKVVYRRLKTFQAFHSPMMEAVREELNEAVEKVTLNPPQIPYISNVTGTWARPEQVTSPGYWVSHTISPIRFADGIAELLKTGSQLFLEIGPGNSLCGFTAQHPQAKESYIEGRQVFSTLPRQDEKVSSQSFFLRALGKCWTAGAAVDWQTFHHAQEDEAWRIPLPTYPFEKKSYWLAPVAQLQGVVQSEDVNARRARVQVAKKTDISNWFYLPRWQQSIAPNLLDWQEAGGIDQRDGWLFFIDDMDEEENFIGMELIEQLKTEYTLGSITIVYAGQSYEKLEEEEGRASVYRINPGKHQDYIALLADMQEQGRGLQRVVHLWQWEDAPFLPPASDVASFLDRGVYSLLYLVKAMGQLSIFDNIEITVVTRGQYQIESGDSCLPTKAAVNGPCKVIPQEYPNITCRCIDFAAHYQSKGSRQINRNSRVVEQEVVRRLIDELSYRAPARFVAYRGSNRWVLTYRPLKLEKGPDIPFVLRENGVYLITGGLGKIGLAIARYLAQAVQACLILTSRSLLSLDDETNPRVAAVREIEAAGGQVLITAADVANKEQMQQVFADAQEKYGPINGIIHAAGVMDESAFKLIAEANATDCAKHFQTKIYGLAVIEEITRDKKLDFCILTSSLSPILGGLSLYAYSAANSFMDAFAQRQRTVEGKNWLSVNWADWQREEPSNVSCANLLIGSTVAQLNITPEEGTETFRRVLTLTSSDTAQIVISSGDLQQRLRQWVLSGENEDKLIGATAPDGIGEDAVGTATAAQAMFRRPQLQGIYEAPGSEAETIIVGIWQDLLGIDQVGVHDNFFELGGHSLIATRLISRLREIFRVDIPLPMLFERPTVREVAAAIAMEWGDAATVEEIAKTYREVFSR